jgi:hypothetical protein
MTPSYFSPNISASILVIADNEVITDYPANPTARRAIRPKERVDAHRWEADDRRERLRMDEY